MYYSKSKDKIYACECKVEKEFLKKSKLKNFIRSYSLSESTNLHRHNPYNVLDHSADVAAA